MPLINALTLSVPFTPQETSLSAQLNQFFETNPAITLLSITYANREAIGTRPVFALSLCFITGVNVLSTTVGGGKYHAVEFSGPQALEHANAFLSSHPSFEIDAFIDLYPESNRYTAHEHFLLVGHDRNSCAPFRFQRLLSVYNNAPINFYTTGNCVRLSYQQCQSVPVLNLNTNTWLSYGPALGIQILNDQYEIATVAVGPNLHTGGSSIAPGPPITPEPVKHPCPCCFRLSSFIIQRGVADCVHEYKFSANFSTCYSGNPINIVKALVSGHIISVGACYCNPANYKMSFPNQNHYKIISVAAYDQGYLVVICFEDLVQPCTDSDFDDAFIYIKLDRCYGACYEAPYVPDNPPNIDAP